MEPINQLVTEYLNQQHGIPIGWIFSRRGPEQAGWM
jgi:hypothetical protein